MEANPSLSAKRSLFFFWFLFSLSRRKLNSLGAQREGRRKWVSPPRVRPRRDSLSLSRPGRGTLRCLCLCSFLPSAPCHRQAADPCEVGVPAPQGSHKAKEEADEIRKLQARGETQGPTLDVNPQDEATSHPILPLPPTHEGTGPPARRHSPPCHSQAPHLLWHLHAQASPSPGFPYSCFLFRK